MPKTSMKSGSNKKTRKGRGESVRNDKNLLRSPNEFRISRADLWSRERRYELLDIVDNLFDSVIGY